MTREKVKEIFYELVRDVCGISDVDDNTVLYDEGADSLDLIELVMECQKKFELSIPDDVGVDWGAKRLGDVVSEIERLLQDQANKC